MSDHRVLDFDTPLEPDDIEVGNVLMIGGEPRTIREVKPLVELPSRLPALTPQLIADMGNGQSQVFYVLTCFVCGTVRAFPGVRGTESWYGIAHGNAYRVYCSSDCVLGGVNAAATG